MRAERPLDVGVVGVGSMGRHHVRVYDGLESANLVGVHDADEERARRIATRYGARSMAFEELLERVDAVSIAVPTTAHYELVGACLRADVATLVEKPLAADPELGRRLLSRVEEADVPVQVGHIERFNPAVEALQELLEGRKIVDITANRLGPPPEGEMDDTAVLDLMIHDIDVVIALLGASPVDVEAAGVAGNRHVSALLEFGSGPVVSLTASHLTQRKVRTLRVTTEEWLVDLDYLDQSIEIHRNSVPEYVAEDGVVRYRHEGVVERLRISNEEPLKRELRSFLETVATDGVPSVTVEEALTALEIARRIEREGNAERTATEATDD